MTTPADEHRVEAERLAQLSLEDQRTIIAMHRQDASNPKVPKRDRDFARERADALENHLKRLRRKRR
jgi:hypothetical protein